MNQVPKIINSYKTNNNEALGSVSTVPKILFQNCVNKMWKKTTREKRKQGKKNNKKKWQKDEDKTKRQRDNPGFVSSSLWTNSDNSEFRTIIVIRQLRVTLDSIRNSCDVYIYIVGFLVINVNKYR